jgi:pimeloyl-ACP methyl ester carboxylesterase
VAWDHRGLHASGPPASDRLDASAHAEDAFSVLDHLGHDEFVAVSWSNGSRIALEIAHRSPERCRALILVSGGYGHPLGRALRFELASILPVAASVAKYFGDAVGGALRRLVARPELAGMIRQSGMVGATADTTAIIELLRGIADCDQKVLLHSFQEVVGDSAIDLLQEITVPSFLISGERDQFVSRALIEETARGLGGAPVVIYEGATHYLPIEFPARLSDDLRKVLEATVT